MLSSLHTFEGHVMEMIPWQRIGPAPCWRNWSEDGGVEGATRRRFRRPLPAKAVAAALGVMGCALSSGVQAQTILGTAETFGILAGSTVTNTGSSVIMGNVGVAPGIAIVGFPPGMVVPPGVFHAGDAFALQAQNDLTTAYNSLRALPSGVDLTGQDLGGMTLTPAIYSFATSAQLTGILTLDGQGNSAAEFVFNIGSSLTTASSSAVLLINGANGNNVYWTVGSSATLGTNSVFAGNILADQSITLNTGATITCGRALARVGAVTLDSNSITLCVSSADGDGGDIQANELFGEGVSGAQQTAFVAGSLFGSAMMGQAAFWRDGAGPDPTGITPQTYRPPMKLGALGATESEQERIVNSGYQPRTWRLWTMGLGGTASLDGNAAAETEDLDMHTAGFAVGFDYQIDRTTLVGIAGGYTHSWYSVDQRLTKGTVEGVQAGLYAVKRLGPLYLAATAEYAHHYNETDRFLDWVVDERATGEFTGDMFSTRLEAGWQRYWGGHRVTPFAGLSVSHLRSEGFTEESDGILGLTFDSNSTTSVVSSLGVQIDTQIALSDGRTLRPFGRVAWIHEFNPDRSVDSALTLSPAATFSPNGALAPGDAARITAGLKLDVNENMGIFALFDSELSGQSQSYAGNGGIRISW